MKNLIYLSSLFFTCALASSSDIMTMQDFKNHNPHTNSYQGTISLDISDLNFLDKEIKEAKLNFDQFKKSNPNSTYSKIYGSMHKSLLEVRMKALDRSLNNSIRSEVNKILESHFPQDAD